MPAGRPCLGRVRVPVAGGLAGEAERLHDRAMASLFLAAALAASATATPARVLDLPALEAAAASARSGHGTSLAGRRFEVTLVPGERGPEHRICTGSPSWGWYRDPGIYEVSGDAGVHELRFFLDGHGNPAVPEAHRPSGVAGGWLKLTSVACRYEREPKRTTKNMYGETVQHEPTREDVVAIAEFRRDTKTEALTVKTDEAGARALAAHIAVRLAGVLGEWSRGQSIVCGADDYSSLDVVILVGEFRGCLIKGRVERIDYIDTQTGQVRLATTVRPRRRGK
jgi:hypothetical protein